MLRNIIKAQAGWLFRMMVVLGVAGVAASACVTECVTTENQCEVCFQKCDQNRYDFKSCSKREDSFPPNSSQNASSLPYGRSDCKKLCCSSNLAQFQITEFSECGEPAKNSLLVPIIVVSVLMFTFVLLCCLFAGTQSLREKLALCLCRKLMQKLDAKLSVNTQLSIQQILDVDEGCSKKERIKRDIVASGEACCPICLENKSNVLGQCGHAFHLDCLWEWVNRKEECPLCKSHGVDKIEVFCRKCLKPCYKLPSLRRISRLKLIEMKEIRCVACLK